MASTDVILSAPDVVAVPMDYDIPPAQEIVPKVVTASVDGSGAAAAFVPMLELLTPAGQVVFRSPTSTVVAAGGSADVSWFHLEDVNAIAETGTTPYETLIFNTGGLVLYWKLDDAASSGVTKDSKGTNDGTVFGSVTQGVPKLADVLAADYVAGMTGRKVDTPVDQTPQVMSMVYWISTLSAVTPRWVAFADSNSANGRWFQIAMDAAGGTAVTIFNNGANAITFGAATAANDGVKHCIAWTYEATNVVTGAGAVGKIYKDGVIVNSTPLNMLGVGLAKSNHSMVLGAKWRNAFDDPAGIEQIVARIDEFAIFNKTLSATEIANINAAGRIV